MKLLTTQEQFEILVAGLEKNPALAKGYQRGLVMNFKSEWESLSTKINAVGPPMRDGDGWYKVWKDLKFKVKKKMMFNRKEANATGGGIYKQMPLSPLEEAVANLMGFEHLLNPAGEACGVPYEHIDLLEEFQSNTPTATAPTTATPSTSRLTSTTATPSTTTVASTTRLASTTATPSTSRLASTTATPSTTNLASTTSTTPSPRTDQHTRLNLLEKLVSIQEKALKMIEENTKQSARYQRKRYLLAKEKATREEELFDLDLKIKKRKLQLLEMQIEN